MKNLLILILTVSICYSNLIKPESGSELTYVYVLFEWEQYQQNPVDMIAIWKGGTAIHGAIIGGAIATWLGYDFPKTCEAIHINILIVRHPDGPQTKEEKKWEESFENNQLMENGYRIQQATKPQTLSYAMMDSPVGVAAWIIEKMHVWSDIKNKDIESVYSKEKLLSNIMVYLVTKTFNTASWIYYGRVGEGGRFLPKEDLPIKVPTAVALFPKEYDPLAPALHAYSHSASVGSLLPAHLLGADSPIFVLSWFFNRFYDSKKFFNNS